MTLTAPARPESTARRARAVVYLRVSTKEQAERGGEAEGFSIPAQRNACHRKAEDLDADVVATFADRGESAKTSQRPELQAILGFVRDHPVDYVIVHKVDRLARNRADDVEITLSVRTAGARLVSCSENIDDSPSGSLMHGIMSAIAEFYSKNLAVEVVKGSTEKAKNGGTLGKAPTGYRNVRVIDNGREVRTVEIDQERGPLMRWAFEQYATGEWSVRRLLDAVTARGLTSSGGPRTPSKPLSLGNFNRLLRTPYYYGVVSYGGVEYPGAHSPLISKTTFDRVQALLKINARSGERRIKYNHYLKGTVWCGKCGSRLSVMNSKNRYGAVYPYFYCLGRAEKRTPCDQKAVLIALVENAVADLYRAVSIEGAERDRLEQFIRQGLEAQHRTRSADRDRQQKRIERLESERQKLLQAHYADAIPLDMLKSEQQRIATEMAHAEQQLEADTMAVAEVIDAISAALRRAEDCHETYLNASTTTRRTMNQAFFERVEISDDYATTPTLCGEYELLLHPDVRTAAEADPVAWWEADAERSHVQDTSSGATFCRSPNLGKNPNLCWLGFW